MKKLPWFLEKRKENFNHLEAGIKNIKGINVLQQPVDKRFSSSHYCLGMMLDQKLAIKRSAIMEMLSKKGVGTSIYYPQPVPRMTYYQSKYGYEEKNFINAALISDGIIALPVGPHLDLSDMDYIIKSIKEVWKEMNV